MHEVNMLRNTKGEFVMLYKQLREYENKFAEYLWMSTKTFDLQFNKIEDKIQKQDTNYKACISPEERLVVTLRYEKLYYCFILFGFIYQKTGYLKTSNMKLENWVGVWQSKIKSET